MRWPHFIRPFVPSFWNPVAQAGPYEPLTLREWQVQSLLSAVPPDLRLFLTSWLLTPARSGWLRDAPPMQRRRLPFSNEALDACDLFDRRALLCQEIQACWQTMEAPAHWLSGLSRNGLLVAHGARLRQLCAALACCAGARPLAEEYQLAIDTILG